MALKSIAPDRVLWRVSSHQSAHTCRVESGLILIVDYTGNAVVTVSFAWSSKLKSFAGCVPTRVRRSACETHIDRFAASDTLAAQLPARRRFDDLRYTRSSLCRLHRAPTRHRLPDRRAHLQAVHLLAAHDRAQPAHRRQAVACRADRLST